ncbi:hybrid sensor histidine kinase/response regulator [Marinagarivorans algicola]|uniref:hybrid sensor histidine kinase/response regulator n=1 Tax=Marinagarivorans algicola TaxID=1513270 RepID=UPI0006B8CBF6|nr:hybrid sensor histidine kinase/response regulator [Marinagarivorans algicola]
MLDIHLLNQPSIKTDASYKEFQLNDIAISLLNNPSKEQITLWLSIIKSQEQSNNIYLIKEKANSIKNLIACNIVTIKQKNQIILIIEDLNLLKIAFGHTKSINKKINKNLLIIFNDNGEIISANHTIKTSQILRNSLKEAITNTTNIEYIKKNNSIYQTIENQFYIFKNPKKIEAKLLPHLHEKQKDRYTLYAIILEPITSPDNNNEHYLDAFNISKKQAEQANDAKGRFLATMSHEIRSPLNAILNMAQLLLNTELTEKQKKYAEIAHIGGQTLMSLINDVLDFSKIEAGHFTLNIAPFNINNLLDDLASIFWIRAAQNNTELAISVHPECDTFFSGDEQRIRQILINLINNAIKFTERGGVHVNIEPHNDKLIKIEVIDSGIGMTSEECRNVFGAFIQAESSENRRFGGTGLGLSIAKQLVELMSGQIHVSSTPNRGSTFTVLLPLLPSNSIDLGREIFDQYRIKKNKHLKQKKIAAFLDCDNSIIEMALEKQLSYWNIKVYYIREITRALTAPIETAFFFGESDEFRENSRHYHKIADRFLSAKRFVFICISDMRLADQMRHNLHRGFTLSLDKPLSAKKLIAVLEEENINDTKDSEISNNSNTHILLVEDGETNRAVALALLEQHNITADIACNGKEALEKIKTRHYPLILMDLSMPIMDGLEATSHIRAGNNCNKETPIIALTANAFAEDRATCIAAGMNDYISKPIDTEIFDQKIEYWLQSTKGTIQENNQKDNQYQQDEFKKTHLTYNKNNKPIKKSSDNILDSRILSQLIKDTSESSIRVILDIYFKELDERIPKMELLFSQEMWSTLGDEAHILKSSSASFGAIELSARAKIIELNIKTNEFGNIHHAMQDIHLLAQKTVEAQKDFLKTL